MPTDVVLVGPTGYRASPFFADL